MFDTRLEGAAVCELEHEECVDGSLVVPWLAWARNQFFRESCVSGSLVAVPWWLALARNRFSGVVR